MVFLRDGGVTNTDWDSGFLKRPFDAASTENFVLTPRVGTKFGVSFSGCDAQNCAGDYGAVLYLPWSHQFFQKEVSPRSVACSETLMDPQNAAALQTLDAALKRQQAGPTRTISLRHARRWGRSAALIEAGTGCRKMGGRGCMIACLLLASRL